MRSSPNYSDLVEVTTEHHKNVMAIQVLEMNALLLQVNALLYGDSRKRSRWELFVWRCRRRVERVRDAWLVLTGQAHIGDW